LPTDGAVQPLTTGKKTLEPVSWAAALKVFERLVGEKVKKGYREIESGGGFTVAAPESTGILPSSSMLRMTQRSTCSSMMIAFFFS
jgi:hypothetical protein